MHARPQIPSHGLFQRAPFLKNVGKGFHRWCDLPSIRRKKQQCFSTVIDNLSTQMRMAEESECASPSNSFVRTSVAKGVVETAWQKALTCMQDHCRREKKRRCGTTSNCTTAASLQPRVTTPSIIALPSIRLLSTLLEFAFVS